MPTNCNCGKTSKTPIKIDENSKEFKNLINNLKGKKFHNDLYGNDVYYLKKQMEKFLNQEAPDKVINDLIKKYNCNLSNENIAIAIGPDCSAASITKLRNSDEVSYKGDKGVMRPDKVAQFYRVVTTDKDSGYPNFNKREKERLQMSINPYFRLEKINEKFSFDTDSCREIKEFCMNLLEKNGISTKTANRGRPKKT